MIRINNIKIRKNISNEEVLDIAINKHHISKSDILNWHISKKSIDARKKDDVHYNFAIDLKLENEDYYINKYKNIAKIKEDCIPNIDIKIPLSTRPVIIGAGPARTICSSYLNSKWFKTRSN